MQIIEDFKIGYKDLVGRWGVFMWRQAERRLSPQAFYSILKPLFFLRAAFNCALRKRGYATLRPDFLRVSRPARAARRQRMNDYMNRVLNSIPDRLSEEKWLQNCRVEGLEHLQLARRNKRPVILATCHFGAFEMNKYWLRAKGILVATLFGGESKSRTPLTQLKDTFNLFHETPIAFYGDQLRAADEFIAAGNPLLVMIDVPVQKQIFVPFCDGWTFQMAAGAVRLAVRHSAELIPCTVVDQGRWRFLIKLGEPVPQELLLSKNDWQAAGKHLMDQLMPVFRTWPEQCRPDLIRCLKLSHEHSPSRELAYR
jgi:hypothetical protein